MPLAWTAAVALIVAAIVALTLLANDRRETFKTEAYGATRQVTDTIVAPVGGVLSTPIGWVRGGVNFVGSYWNASNENRRLKRELAEMRQWQSVAVALKDRNERLETVLGLRTDPPIPMATARAVIDSRGPFANARLIDAGSKAGIAIGNPAMSERGLVGRVVGVSPNISRVMLLTDVASRTPVMIDRTNARAILSGDGGPNPKLDYLRGREPVKQGDRVLTSGDGGVFPRGLPVGTAVKGLDGHWRVALDADSGAIDFVRVMMFKDFSAFADQKALSTVVIPPVTTPDPGAAAPPIIPTQPSGAQPAAAQPGTAAPARPAVAPPARPAPQPTVPRPIPTPAQTAPTAPPSQQPAATGTPR